MPAPSASPSRLLERCAGTSRRAGARRRASRAPTSSSGSSNRQTSSTASVTRSGAAWSRSSGRSRAASLALRAAASQPLTGSGPLRKKVEPRTYEPLRGRTESDRARDVLGPQLDRPGRLAAVLAGGDGADAHAVRGEVEGHARRHQVDTRLAPPRRRLCRAPAGLPHRSRRGRSRRRRVATIARAHSRPTRNALFRFSSSARSQSSSSISRNGAVLRDRERGDEHVEAAEIGQRHARPPGRRPGRSRARVGWERRPAPRAPHPRPRAAQRPRRRSRRCPATTQRCPSKAVALPREHPSIDDERRARQMASAAPRRDTGTTAASLFRAGRSGQRRFGSGRFARARRWPIDASRSHPVGRRRTRIRWRTRDRAAIARVSARRPAFAAA